MSVEPETRVRPSNERWKEIERLLDLALEQPADERRAFLEQACPDDPALLEEVNRLLRSCERPEAWLDGQAPTYAAPLVGEAEESETTEGVRIGPYRIVREAGRGGMGTVYLAERDDGQFQQRVALKLVRARARRWTTTWCAASSRSGRSSPRSSTPTSRGCWTAA